MCCISRVGPQRHDFFTARRYFRRGRLYDPVQVRAAPFAESDWARAAKIGIIAASVIASAFGALLLASNAEKVRIGPSAELESPDD